MNRRDLMKGLAALPIATGTAAHAGLCGGTVACQPANKPLQVIFDGPFSVVLQTASPTSDDITGVMVFSPIEPQGQHLIKLNGVPLDEKKLHHFSLNITGFTPPHQPCVSHDFSDFCKDHTRFDASAADRFVTVTLPCPKNIITDTQHVPPLPVTVGGQPRSMPQSHVLEYDLPNNSKITMDYRESGHPASPLGNAFIFEVGMDHPDSDCSHARDFYNKSMLPFFPDLNNDLQHNAIAFPTCPTVAPHLYFLQFKSRGEVEPIHIFTTTLECKSGGLIVTNP